MLRIQQFLGCIGCSVLATLLVVSHGAQAQDEEGHDSLWLDLGHTFRDPEGRSYTPLWRIECVSPPLRQGLGIEVSSLDGALRSQLGLPADQGLVITRVFPGSPAEEARLEQHDVLLTIAETDVGTPEALDEQIAVAEQTVPVVVIRRGKKITIELTPGPDPAEPWIIAAQRRYVRVSPHWIGVGVAEADDTLRSQLRLPETQGLVVTEVEPDSPAAKAGIQLHDVLLEFGGKRLSAVDDLRAQIAEVGETPATMKLLRAGRPVSLQVTPSKRFDGTSGPPELTLAVAGWTGHSDINVYYDSRTGISWSNPNAIVYDLAGPALYWTGDPASSAEEQPEEDGVEEVPPEPQDSDEKLSRLIEQVQALAERIESLEQTIQATRASQAPDE